MTLTQHRDDYHGHVTVHHAGSTEPVAVLVDCGDTVAVHDPRKEPWTTEEAREIGAALIGWAVRKEQDGG